MALFKCPECGREISTAAPNCPACGYPVVRSRERTTSKGLLALIGCLVAIPIVLVGVAILGLLAAIAIPSFMKARETSQRNQCINNLEIIDEAKADWGRQHNSTNGFLIPEDQFKQFLAQQHPGSLTCPNDPDQTFQTSYGINPLGVAPECLCDNSHALEYGDDPDDANPGPPPAE